MRRRNTPPIVGKPIKYTQHNDEERSGPFGFEANCNHGARRQTKDGHEEAGNTPFSLNNETQEKEYEEHTTGE